MNSPLLTQAAPTSCDEVSPGAFSSLGPSPEVATAGTAASTSQSCQPTESPAAADPGGVPWVLLAAALTGLIAVGLARAKSRSESRERSRLLFAEAYQWYAAYKEFPYAVRRRRTTPRNSAPADERIRLSEALRTVQEKLDYFRVWTALEDKDAGAAYSRLLAELRKVAGGSIRAAWREPGATRDEDMNIPPSRVDLSALQEFETQYQDAVRTALRRRWWQLP